MNAVKGILDSLDIGAEQNSPEVKAALEGQDFDALWNNLVKVTNSFERWLDADRCNGYHFMGMESAYIKDRSVFKGAWIRFKMAFSLHRDKSMVEYVKILKDVDPNKVSPAGSDNVILGKSNVEAFDELMDLMVSFDSTVITKEATQILKHMEGTIDKNTRTLLVALLALPIPFVNIIASVILILQDKKLNNESQEVMSTHGEKLMAALTKVIKHSEIDRGLNLKYDNNGSLSMEDIGKIVSRINRVKMMMLPPAARAHDVPRWFKKKQYVSSEDKKEIVGRVQKNADKYIRALGNGPTGMSHAARVIMSAEKIQNMYDYGMDFGGTTSIEGAYADLATAMFLAFIDVTTTAMILTQDLKHY